MAADLKNQSTANPYKVTNIKKDSEEAKAAGGGDYSGLTKNALGKGFLTELVYDPEKGLDGSAIREYDGRVVFAIYTKHGFNFNLLDDLRIWTDIEGKSHQHQGTFFDKLRDIQMQLANCFATGEPANELAAKKAKELGGAIIEVKDVKRIILKGRKGEYNWNIYTIDIAEPKRRGNNRK